MMVLLLTLIADMKDRHSLQLFPLCLACRQQAKMVGWQDLAIMTAMGPIILLFQHIKISMVLTMSWRLQELISSALYLAVSTKYCKVRQWHPPLSQVPSPPWRWWRNITRRKSFGVIWPIQTILHRHTLWKTVLPNWTSWSCNYRTAKIWKTRQRKTMVVTTRLMQAK